MSSSKSPVPSVLFVCTANRIRSPMAEVMFRAKLMAATDDWQKWEVGSAGTWATPGRQTFPEAQEIMVERSLDISNHRSRMVTEELLKRFNLVLTMEPGQKEALQLEFPGHSSKIYTLSEMAGVLSPIEDPVGGGLSAFEKTASEIEYWIDAGMERIKKLAY